MDKHWTLFNWCRFCIKQLHISWTLWNKIAVRKAYIFRSVRGSCSFALLQCYIKKYQSLMRTLQISHLTTSFSHFSLISLTVPSSDANLTHVSKSVVHFSLIPLLIWNGPLLFVFLRFITGQEFCLPPPVCLRSSDLCLETSDYRLLSVDPANSFHSWSSLKLTHTPHIPCRSHALCHPSAESFL